LVQIYPEAFQSRVAFNDSVLSEKNDFKNIFTYGLMKIYPEFWS
jgi:hypothetical protein